MDGLIATQRFCSWRASMSLPVRRLINWWHRELSVLVSREIVEWLTGKSRLAVVIAPTNAFVDIELIRWPHQILSITRVNAETFSNAEVLKFIQEHKLDAVEIDVGLRVPESQVFRRRFSLPAQAEPDIDLIAENDLITRTPFRLADVYVGWAYSRVYDQNTLVVTQWLILRSIILDIASRLELSLDNLRFVVVSGSESSSAAFIPLHSAGPPTPRRFGTIVLALTASALLLSAIGTGVEYMRQESLIDALDARVSTSRVTVERVEAMVDKIKQRRSIVAHLHALKFEEAGALDIWENISTLLPAHSWLTELRIAISPHNDIRALSMHGFSTSASTLIGIVEQSGLFFNAALTAPIVVDNQVNRERFSLQANISRRDAQPGSKR